MVTTFKNHVHADQVKNVQYVREGDTLTTATLYGVTPTSPSFTHVDIDGGTLVSTASYVRVERRKAGTMGRIGKSTHKTKFSAQLIFNASNDNNLLQEWCINESLITDADTPSNSMTFLQSYNVGGTETFEILTGCHPTRTSISFSNTGFITFTVDLRVRNRDENTTALGGLTTPTFAPALTAVPWTASDGGVDHFDWNTTAEAINGMTIVIDRQYAVSEPTESTLDMFAQESIRAITGTVDIIKRDSTVSVDAFASTERAMNITLKSGSGGTVIAFTVATLENPSGQSLDPNSADPLIESYSFEAQTAVMTTTP